MPGTEPRRPEALTDSEREVLHRAHQRLRNTSQALEALVATDPIRGRWAPEPAPAEALQAARIELAKAYEALERHNDDLVDWGATPKQPDDGS